MRNILFAIIAGTTLVSAAAQAQDASKFYGNVGYSVIDTRFSDLDALGGRLGYDFTPNFALEAEGGIGLGSKKFLGVDVKIDKVLGAYLVGKLPLSDNFELLGRVGYSHVYVSASGFGSSANADNGSGAFGIGAQYLFNGKNGVRGDYTRYEENGSGSNGYTISYVRKF
jgi:outer membrane immunogenic protein